VHDGQTDRNSRISTALCIGLLSQIAMQPSLHGEHRLVGLLCTAIRNTGWSPNSSNHTTISVYTTVSLCLSSLIGVVNQVGVVLFCWLQDVDFSCCSRRVIAAISVGVCDVDWKCRCHTDSSRPGPTCLCLCLCKNW